MSEKISQAGVYDLPMDAYHGDLCVGPSISGSGLIKLEQTCPAKFWVGSYLNPERVEKKTAAMDFGAAMHKLLLEGDAAFRQAYAVTPEGHSGRTKEGKAWVAEREALGLGVIDHDDWQAMSAMVAEVRKHPLANKALSDGQPERSIIWQDEQTGIWLKARPDWLPARLHFVPNFKTAASVKPDDWARQAFTLGYHQSTALVLDGLAQVLGWDDAIAYFLVQEKELPYLVQPMALTEEAIGWARMLNRKAINTFAACIKANHWPGYADDVIDIGMPTWVERGLQKRSEKSEFTDQHGGFAA